MIRTTTTRINNETVNEKPKSLRFIPLAEQTHAMRVACVKAHPFDIAFITHDRQTQELKMLAVTGDYRAIRHIRQPDERLCDAAIMQSERAWEMIKTSYETWDGLMKYGAVALKHCPARYKDKALCQTAVFFDPMSFEFVPEKIATYAMCQQAWEKTSESDKPALFKVIPERYRNKAFCKEAIRIDPMLLEYVPLRVQEQDPGIAKMAIRLDPDSACFSLVDQPQGMRL